MVSLFSKDFSSYTLRTSPRLFDKETPSRSPISKFINPYQRVITIRRVFNVYNKLHFTSKDSGSD